MAREKVIFTPNVPVSVALKYPVGKIVSGTFGEQVYYTTADDKAMYLDMHVGQMVNELSPKVGELLVITKRWTGRKGESASWTVERAQPQLPKPDPGDQLQEQLYGSIAAARARKLGEQGDGTFAISAPTNEDAGPGQHAGGARCKLHPLPAGDEDRADASRARVPHSSGGGVMAREKVIFDPNVPVHVALKYPVGKIVSGTYGEQVYYTTSDDKAMYLDLGVGKMVNDLSPKVGELLIITKKSSGRRGEPVNWTVERAQPQLPKPDPGDQLQEQLYGSIAAARARKLGEQGDGTFAISAPTNGATALAPRKQPETAAVSAEWSRTLTAEANALTDAYVSAWKYARERYEGQVKPDEVKSFIITAYIQVRKMSASHA